MSSGQISGAGASPISQQQLPDDKALDNAEGTEVIRLKNGKFKIGTSQGSVFNRTVRKVLMPKTYQREAAIATQKQQAAAFNAVDKASGNKLANVGLGDRQITVAQYRNLLNPPAPAPSSPPAPQVPDIVVSALRNPDTPQEELPAAIYDALASASAGMHKGYEFKEPEIAGGINFGNILPPKHTAIHVTGEVSGAPGVRGEVAFHANTVGSSYIATQGPKSNSASPGYNDYFYQMLASQDTHTVVNLTNDADVKSSIPKNRYTGEPIPGKKPKLAKQYWPDTGKTAQYGENKVKTSKWEKGKDFDVVTLQITRPDNSSKEVKIFQFKKWPDHGIPNTPEKIESFHRFNEAVQQHGETGRTTVHCRAGVGRTGVFITLDQLRKEANEGSITHANLLQRTSEIVWSGREDRGPSFVQKKEQFEFIISEMRNELNRLAEQGSTTTETSNPGDFDDEPMYGNLPFHEEQSALYENFSVAGRGAPTPPPSYTPTSQSILANWDNYNSAEEIIDDINLVNDQVDLENFQSKLLDSMGQEGISKADLEYYGKLVKAIEKRTRDM